MPAKMFMTGYDMKTEYFQMPYSEFCKPINTHLLKMLMNVWAKGADAALHDLGALVNVLLDPVEGFHILRTAKEFHKIFIVSYHQELKVSLSWAAFDYPAEMC